MKIQKLLTVRSSVERAFNVYMAFFVLILLPFNQQAFAQQYFSYDLTGNCTKYFLEPGSDLNYSPDQTVDNVWIANYDYENHPENTQSSCIKLTSSDPAPNLDGIDCIIREPYAPLMDSDIKLKNEIYVWANNNTAPIEEGLGVLDIIIMRQHILRIDYIDDRFGMLAADMNEDGKISALDMVAIRSILLNRGNINNTPVWKFLPTAKFFDYSPTRQEDFSAFYSEFLLDPFNTTTYTYPNYFDSHIMLYARRNNETNDNLGVNFENSMATIKMGDVDGSLSLNLNGNYVIRDFSQNDVTVTYESVWGLHTADNTIDDSGSISVQDFSIGLENNSINALGFYLKISVDQGIDITNISFDNSLTSNNAIFTDYEIDGNEAYILVYNENVQNISVPVGDIIDVQTNSTSGSYNCTIEEMSVVTDQQTTADWKVSFTPPPSNIIDTDHLIFRDYEVRLNDKDEHITDYQVYNIHGKLLAQKSNLSVNNIDLKSLLSSEQSGIYFMSVRTNLGERTIKVPYFK